MMEQVSGIPDAGIVEFYDVFAGSGDTRGRVERFRSTERGFLRAKEYARNYNESLREAMRVPLADLELERCDWLARPDEYERAMQVELYREHTASVIGVTGIPVNEDDAPLPDSYPHEF